MAAPPASGRAWIVTVTVLLATARCRPRERRQSAGDRGVGRRAAAPAGRRSRRWWWPRRRAGAGATGAAPAASASRRPAPPTWPVMSLVSSVRDTTCGAAQPRQRGHRPLEVAARARSAEVARRRRGRRWRSRASWRRTRARRRRRRTPAGRRRRSGRAPPTATAGPTARPGACRTAGRRAAAYRWRRGGLGPPGRAAARARRPIADSLPERAPGGRTRAGRRSRRSRPRRRRTSRGRAPRTRGAAGRRLTRRRRPARPRPPAGAQARPATAAPAAAAAPRAGAGRGAAERVRRSAVERAGDLGRSRRPLGAEDQRQLGQLGVTRDRPARRRAWRRSPPARPRSRAPAAQLVASQASLSFCIVRYSIVPAADLADPEHARDLGVAQAGVELQRDDLALACGQRGQRRPHRRAAQRHLGAVVDARRPSSSAGSVTRRRHPPPAAQLVERGVARDPEQPRRAPRPGGDRTSPGGGRPARTPARSRPRRRRDRRAACRRRRRRRRGWSDTAPRIAAALCRRLARATGVVSRSHPHYGREPIHHVTDDRRLCASRAAGIVGLVRAAFSATAAAIAPSVSGAAGTGARAGAKRQADPTAAAARAERSGSLWATVNICSSRGKGKGGELGVRGQMPSLGFASTLRMTVQLGYWSASSTSASCRSRAPSRGDQPVAGRVDLGPAAGRRRSSASVDSAGLLDAPVDFSWTRGGHVIGETDRQHHRRPSRRRLRQSRRTTQRGQLPAPLSRRHRWQPGHQKVVRLSSPWPRARIVVPQRGHGRPLRRNTRRPVS